MSGAILLRPAHGTAVEVRAQADMLVATKTATVTDEYGDPHDITAGVSRVVAGHFLATTYPELFGPERVTPGTRTKRTRAAASAPSRRLRPMRPAPCPNVVLLDSLEPTITVKLRERARELVKHEGVLRPRRLRERWRPLRGGPIRTSATPPEPRPHGIPPRALVGVFPPGLVSRGGYAEHADGCGAEGS